MKNCYCQIVYCITKYYADGPEARVVVGVCLFNVLPELLFLSYIARYQALYSKSEFVIGTKNRKYTNFSNVGYERLFFHLAQVFGAVNSKLPPGQVMPLWLQVCRSQESVMAHKRIGFIPTAISDMPKKYHPDGAAATSVPLILNSRDLLITDRMMTMCLKGMCNTVHTPEVDIALPFLTIPDHVVLT